MSGIPSPDMSAHAVPRPSLKPHRGTAVLVLGILGLVVCAICGVIAWVMGNTDLREMEMGVMDPSGMGMTTAGKICGMISSIIAVVVIGGWILMFVFFLVLGAIGAAAGAGATPAG